jgi:hypothetical protein
MTGEKLTGFNAETVLLFNGWATLEVRSREIAVYGNEQ